ncbi:MAG: hypothetical protein K2H85_03445, partial [Allobaculum sp.]|nr:hypothetical protein [Allobaculum sp.]
MINKKRLAMLALAASMVLPTNLTYLSGVTPILAQDATPEVDLTSVNEKIKTLFTTEGQSQISEVNQYSLLVKSGTYTLTEDITSTDLDKVILIPENETVTLDLAGKTISSSAWYTLRVKGTLIIKGSGTIDNAYSPDSDDVGSVIWVDTGDLTIGSLNSSDEVTIKSTTQDNIYMYGVSVAETASESTITINNASFSTDGGVYVNGKLPESNTTSIELTDVTMDCSDGGIYQAGPASITIKNSEEKEIKGAKFGIETRAGKLTIDGGKITGGNGEIVSASNSNGSTTENAGFVLAQHSTKLPIEADIKNATVSGTAALFIGNPQQNEEEDLSKIQSIEVANSELNGSSYDVAYSEDVISFELKN